MLAFWTAVGSAFALVFLAELGDKSQMLALGLGTRHRLGPLIAGGVLAAAVATALSVAVGGLLAAALPAATISLIGGLIFLGFGIWGLWPRADSLLSTEEAAARTAPDADDRIVRCGARQVWATSAVTAFTTILIAEFGDKTMLVTATLATRSHVVAVWLGATLALSVNLGLGAAAGRLLDGRVSPARLRVGSGALFAVIGLLLIIDSLRT